MKGRFLRWVAALLLFVLPVGVRAQFTFTTNNGAITITGWAGSLPFPGELSIPSTTNGFLVTSIGPGAFGGRHLTNVIFGENITAIGSNAFWGCSLTNVIIPNSIITIGDEAFASCGNLTNVTIADSVITIGEKAFQYSGLRSVTIGNGVLNIGYRTFDECYYLSNVTFGDSITNIGLCAFYECYDLTNVTIPNSVISIGDAAFMYSGLSSATIGNSVISIGDSAFAFTWLKIVIIPDSVIYITKSAFYECNALTSVTIGDGVASIGNEVFYECYSLTNISIGAGVTSIANDVFDRCFGLTSISVATNNPAYSSVAGVVFNKDQTRFVQCPEGKSGSYLIPYGVTSIGTNAFMWSKLTNITVPDSVTNIEDAAFSWCQLAGIYFQGNAPSLGSSVFYEGYATIYYLPWTTGWGPMFGGCPTAVWMPPLVASGASASSQMNKFGFNITWAGGQTVVIEACTDLSSPNWQPVQTNTVVEGSSYFNDPQFTNYPGRFYRLRAP